MSTIFDGAAEIKLRSKVKSPSDITKVSSEFPRGKHVCVLICVNMCLYWTYKAREENGTIPVMSCFRVATETVDQISPGQIRRRQRDRKPVGVRLTSAHRVRGTPAGRRRHRGQPGRRSALLDRQHVVSRLLEKALGGRW